MIVQYVARDARSAITAVWPHERQSQTNPGPSKE